MGSCVRKGYIMYFFTPVLGVLAVYILAAIVPAFFLLRFIYRHDHIEKEPGSLLIALLVGGVLSALCSIVLESVLGAVLDLTVAQDTIAYHVIMAFVVVAAVEEGTKLFFLKRRTWKNPNFNYLFDGIVYAVFVSLGFAAYENIKYVFAYGLSVALPRAFLAIPGHMGFAVFMGIFYARAKKLELMGDHARSRKNLWGGYLTATALHGFYDSCCFIGTGLSTLIFLAFVGIMYVMVFRLVKNAAYGDRPM